MLDSRATQAGQLAFAQHSTVGFNSRTLLNAGAAPGNTSSAAAAATVPGPGVEGNSVLSVESALELLEAIVGGTSHIVVTKHLNLNDVADNADLATIVSDGLPAEVLSITVCPHLCLHSHIRAERALPRASNVEFYALGHT